MYNTDGFFHERCKEMGLHPVTLMKEGKISTPMRLFLAMESERRSLNDEEFDQLCELLNLRPETALRHLKVTKKDTIIRERYPNYYHPGVVKKNVKFRVSKIDALAREARRHSMDYGKYVGMLYLEQEQSVMDRYREYNLRRALGERLPE